MRLISEGIYAFEHEGILVTIPAGMENIIPWQKDLVEVPEMWRQTDFKPLRILMNLGFVDLNNPEAVQLKFDKPISIRVHYRWSEKVEAARVRKPFSLAYWQKNQWNPSVALSDEFPLLSHEWAGFVKIEIPVWEDPPIALGL